MVNHSVMFLPSYLMRICDVTLNLFIAYVATGGGLMSARRLIMVTRPPQRDMTPIITYIENIFIALTPIHSNPTLMYYSKNH